MLMILTVFGKNKFYWEIFLGDYVPLISSLYNLQFDIFHCLYKIRTCTSLIKIG